MGWTHQDAANGVLIGSKDVRVWIEGDVVPAELCDFDLLWMKATQGHYVFADEAPVEERGDSLLML
jgi:hypothetical protein